MLTGRASLSFPDSSAVSFGSFFLFFFSSSFPISDFDLAVRVSLQNVGSDHSHNGRQPRAIRASFLERPGFRMSLCPSLAWGGCRGREFPRTCASPHPVPTLTRVIKEGFSVTVVRHMREIKSVENSQGRELRDFR